MSETGIESEAADLKQVSLRSSERNYTLQFSDPQDHILKTIRETGRFYEAALLEALLPFLDSSDLVLDVGANIGNHSIFFAGESQCQVLAFEPVTDAYQLLLANIDSNGLEFLIHPRNFALGASPGHADVGNLDPSNLGATRLIPAQDEGIVVVRTLDSVPELQDETVRLIKIDVEGMEVSVLEGAVTIIERDAPILVVECQTDADFGSVDSLLKSLGYRGVECFNATPTYIFLRRDWTGSTTYSTTDFLMDASLRSSRGNQTLSSEVSRLRRLISSEHKSILDVQNRVDSIAVSRGNDP